MHVWMSRRFGQVSAVLSVATVVLVACTSTTARDSVEESESGSEPPLDAEVMALGAGALDPKRVEFPLDPYTDERAGLDVIGHGLDVAQQQCLRRYGLDLPVPERGSSPQWPLPTWDWYGLWDEDTAAEYGYGSPPLGGGGTDLLSTVPLEWRPVLIGEVDSFNGEPVSEGGCQAEAFQAIGDTGDEELVDVGSLQRDAVNRARQHSEVDALIADWSACLADGGWEFKDPIDPFHHWPDTGSVRPPEELEMASFDIGCKKETGLLQTWVAAEVAYQRILVEENADSLRELQDWRDEARRNANEIVAGAE